MNQKELREKLMLYAITDRSWLHGASLDSQVEQALRGGVTFLQLREKELSRTEFLEEAKSMKELCHRYGVPLIINDDVELAWEVDADGVHVGQSDMSAGDVRKRLGPDKIIGVSARTVEQALLAQQQGADYLGSGAVFGTDSKADAKRLDHEVLRQICKAVQIPVVAIGGIHEGNVHELAGNGISGVAVISAIFAKPDIEKAAAELKDKVREMIR